jgi:hypothetical protein
MKPGFILVCVVSLAGIGCSSGARSCQSNADCPSGQACLSAACAPVADGPIAVAVAPGGDSSHVLIGSSVPFQALITGSADQDVIWSLEPANGAQVDASGVFTATRAGTWKVVARSAVDASKSGSALAVVVPVQIASPQPTGVSLPLGGQQQFSAGVQNARDHSVRWDVVEPGGGTITSSGLYLAPQVAATPATFHVRATSNQDQTLTSVASVVVHDTNIQIIPPAATIQSGASLVFTTPSQPVTWSLQEFLGPLALNSLGLFTAPVGIQTPATVHVVATSTENSSKFAVATVTIPAVGIAVSPPSASVRFNNSVELSATVTNSTDLAAQWFFDSGGGTLTPTGPSTVRLTAPPPGLPSSARIRACADADCTKTAFADVTFNLQPGIQRFTATPAVAPPGAAVTLSWVIDGTASLSIDNGVGPVSGGSVVVHPQATSTYMLSAANTEGQATAAVTVQVAPGVPTIASFDASSGRLLPGESATLTWNVLSADSVDIEPGIGPVAASGSVAVSPSADTRYTLTAVNARGTSTANAAVGLARFRLLTTLNVPRQAAFLDRGFEFVPLASQSQSMARLPDGTFLLVGGISWQYDSVGKAHAAQVDSAEIFDPAANDGEGDFSRVLPAVGELSPIALVPLPSGKVVAAGALLQVYDSATGNFVSNETGPSGPHSSGVALPDGRVALFGASQAGLYDVTSDQFTPACCGSFADSGPPVLLPSGKVLVPGSFLQRPLIFDPAASSFTSSNVPTLGSPLGGMVDAFTLGNGNVIFIPGAGFTLYDPGTDTIVGSAPRPNEFFYAGDPAVLLPNGMVLILGVDNFFDRPMSLLFDPIAGITRVGPTPLFFHPAGFAAVISDHAAIFAGGMGGESTTPIAEGLVEVFEWH